MNSAVRRAFRDDDFRQEWVKCSTIRSIRYNWEVIPWLADEADLEADLVGTGAMSCTFEGCAGRAHRGRPWFFQAMEVDPMAPMKIPSRHPNPNPGDLFDSHSLSHAARCLHVSRRAIRQMLARGELPFIQVRGAIRVPRWALDSLNAE